MSHQPDLIKLLEAEKNRTYNQLLALSYAQPTEELEKFEAAKPLSIETAQELRESSTDDLEAGHDISDYFLNPHQPHDQSIHTIIQSERRFSTSSRLEAREATTGRERKVSLQESENKLARSPSETVEELSKAVVQQDIDRMKALLEGLGAQKRSWLINNASISQRPILSYAAIHGNVEMVHFLMDNGVNPCLTRIPDGVTGEDPLDPFSHGTALHVAIRYGQYHVVCAILSVTSKKDYHHQNDNGCNGERFQDFRMLVNLKDNLGATPLVALPDASILPNDQFTSLVEILCEKGADPNAKDPMTGRSLLFKAVERNSTAVCRILLRAGALVGLKDNQENTALHLAARGGKIELVSLILQQLEKGAVNEKNSDGNTAMHMAASAGSRECITLLLNHGGDLSSQNDDFETPIDVIYSTMPRPTNFLLETFDSKITPNDTEINDPCFKINIDYQVLFPSSSSQMTVVVTLMKSLRSLDRMRILSHPLIETFLRAKWRRLRVFFFALCFLHILFVASLSFHVIWTVDDHANLVWSRRLLIVTTVLLTVHEIAQIFLAPRYFLMEGETWLTITCIFCAFIISLTGEFRTAFPVASNNNTMTMSKDDEEDSWTRQMASYAVLLAWGQLMFVLGRFPTFGVFALMFFTVLKNITKVMIIWCCLVIGFAISFYIQNQTMMKYGHFAAFIRTSVMLMGEYQFDEFFPPPTNEPDPDLSLRFGPRWQSKHDNLGVTTQIVFLLFVLLGSIVLVNLMIGMAVSDIQGLSNEGYLRHMIKQAEFLLHMDSLFSRFKIFKARKTIQPVITISPNKGRNVAKKEFNRLWLSIPSSLMESLIHIALKNTQKGSDVSRPDGVTLIRNDWIYRSLSEENLYEH